MFEERNAETKVAEQYTTMELPALYPYQERRALCSESKGRMNVSKIEQQIQKKKWGD